MSQVPKKSNKSITKLAPAAADDTVPRPAPEPTPATSKVTPSGPTVPEVSMLFATTGQSLPKSKAGLACEHICPAHAHMLSTGAIPKIPRDHIQHQQVCGPCSLSALEDLLNGRNDNCDPNESFIFIGASGSEDDEYHGERAFVAAAAASLALGMIDISPELQIPPRPTVVHKKPRCAKPRVPEVSALFDSNNNSNKNCKLSPPPAVKRKDPSTAAPRVLKTYPSVDPNECPSGFCRPPPMTDANKRSTMLDNLPSPPGSTLLRYHRAIQTMPDVCDKWTQVSLISSNELKENAGSNVAMKGGSGGYLMTPSFKTKGKKAGCFVDPTINKKERQLTRDMVVQALNDLNNIFALPTYPDHDVVSIQFLSSPENYKGIIRKQANIKKKGIKKNLSQPVPKVVSDLTGTEDPKDKSFIMRELAKKYLPDWQEKLVFDEDNRNAKETQTPGNVPINSGIRAAIVSDEAEASSGSNKTAGKAFEELVDEFIKPAPLTHHEANQTMAVKSSKPPVGNNPRICNKDQKVQAKIKEGMAGSCDPAYQPQGTTEQIDDEIGEDAGEDEVVSDIPIALCRAEKELLMAFRERRVIMIMNRPNTK